MTNIESEMVCVPTEGYDSGVEALQEALADIDADEIMASIELQTEDTYRIDIEWVMNDGDA